MRNLHPSTESEARKEMNRPVEIYEVYLDDTTLYFTNHDQNIDFAGETWLALGLSRSHIATNIDTRVDECTVSLDNVTRELSALIAHTEFVRRRMRIQKVFLELIDDPDHAVVVFDGYMDEPVITQEAMRVTVRSRLDTLTLQTPRRTYSRLCGWKFGSEECGIDLSEVTVSGTIGSISSNGLVITDTSRTEGSGYYTDGVMTVGSESRMVVESGGSEITLEYPFDHAETGDPYILRRGCNKTLDESCVGRFDNGSNFGGFASVPSPGSDPD